MTLAAVEPTKVCAVCRDRKPWSAFPPRYDKPIPHSYCRTCMAKYRREYHRRRYAEDRAYRERCKAHSREMDAVRRRRAGRSVRKPATVSKGRPLDPAPFAAWLTERAEHYGSLSLVAAVCGFGQDDRNVRAIVNGEVGIVYEGTVDRALQREGSTMLDELYPMEEAA